MFVDCVLCWLSAIRCSLFVVSLRVVCGLLFVVGCSLSAVCCLLVVCCVC